MELSLISLNVKGIRDIVKRKAIFLFCKEMKADFIFLQESHSSSEDVPFWKNQWGDELWSNHSAGVIILKGSFRGKILYNQCDVKGHWVILVIEIGSNMFILCNVYGYNSCVLNHNLLDTIEENVNIISTKFPMAKVIIGGDFNMVQDNALDRLPPRISNKNNNLQNFSNNLALIDIWRYRNPSVRQFTWSNKQMTQQSRIDFWLTSSELDQNVLQTKISPAILTDHKVLTRVQYNCKNSGYWKLNNSFLHHQDYVEHIQVLINKYWIQANIRKEYGTVWELLKFEIRKFSIQFGKQLAMKKRTRIQDIIKEISNLNQSSTHPSNSDNLENLQKELDCIYQEKARGAFVRSRRKWMEEGERNSKYFFNLEKRSAEINLIRKLKINSTVTEDLGMISEFVSKYYADIYSLGEDQDNIIIFKTIKNPKTLSLGSKTECSQDLSLNEIEFCIKALKNNKSPGNDGLTSEFYKAFINDVSRFLLAVYEEAINKGSLPASLRQGVITLIPKRPKYILLLENWRPISLLNNDYKIMASIFAKRMKNALNEIIDETQCGFMKGRHIFSNIRLVIDLVQYSNLLNGDPLILFLDFRKAFDTVNHNFIFDLLKFFGFGQYFIKSVKNYVLW